MTDSRDPEVLDALAASYAAACELERARETAEKALALAGSDAALAAQIRLRLYSRREPYVEELP